MPRNGSSRSRGIRRGRTRAHTPYQKIALGLLETPAESLKETIEAEVAKNPVLELKDQDGPEASGELPQHYDDRYDTISRNGRSQRQERRVHRNSHDGVEQAQNRYHNMLQNAPDRVSSHEFLMQQLHCDCELSGCELAFAEYLIGNLNEKGYLIDPFDSLLGSFNATTNTAVTDSEALRALHTIQTLTPIGVGASGP